MLNIDLSRYLPIGMEARAWIDPNIHSLNILLTCTYADVARMDYDPACIPEGDSRFHIKSLETSFRCVRSQMHDPDELLEQVMVRHVVAAVEAFKREYPHWPWSTACSKCGSFACDFENCQPTKFSS